MAANRFVIVSPAEIACYNNDSPKTVLQVQAPPLMRVKVLGWSISFDGISVNQAPMIVELARQADAGTGSTTTASALESIPETVQSGGMYNATVEPTKGVILDSYEIHPQAGFDVKYPDGEQPVIPPAGFIGLIVNASVAVNCSAKFICEE